MATVMNHDEIRDLLGAFALDAVEAFEAATVAAHLEGCPRCRDEVGHFQRAASMLANTGGDAPAGIWDAIAARIDRPVTPTRAFPNLAAPTPRPAVTPLRPRRPTPRRVGALAAAAAVTAIAVLGVEVGRLDHRLNQVTAAPAGQTLNGAARAALLDPSARRISLASTVSRRPPVGEIVALASGPAFWFNQGLPALTSAKTYQLWAMVDGQAISVAVLGAHPATVAFSLDAAAATNAFAVTVEPAGGSVAPTRPPVASTTL